MKVKHWTVCRLDEITDPGARSFSVGGGEWPFPGFVVQKNGRVSAFANVCAHLGYPLNMAEHDFMTPDGRMLRCAFHGAVYELDNGLCIEGPCVGKSLKALDCRVEDGSVIVIAPESLRDIDDF